MQRFCNTWNVRNLLVLVLRLNRSRKWAESIVSLPNHHAAQARYQLLSVSTVYTQHLECHRQYQGTSLPVAPNCPTQTRSPQTAGDLNISNYTILNTFKLPTGWISLSPADRNGLNPLRMMNSTSTNIQSKTWMLRRLGLSTTATSSAADGNICWLKHSAEKIHCQVMGMQHSMLAWEESTNQSPLPICDT
jgi:hypothetical protein